MKRNLIFLAVALSAAVSCDLTTVPEDNVTPDSYFKSPVSHEQWLNKCYSQFDDVSMYMMEADDVVDKMPTRFFNRTLLPSTETWNWTMLRHINYYLEHADICEDKAAVEYYKSIALFHRAWFYFNMVRQYGDIMWYDKVIGSTDADLLYKSRDDRAFVVERIIEDLDAAASGLAGTEKNALSTNITEWAALALKTRVCLFEGTFRKYHGLDGYEHFLEECVKAADRIISSGKFSVYSEGETPYRDAFFFTNYPECEAILCRAYSSALSMNHTLDVSLPAGGTGFTQRFVNHYLMKDGSRITSVEGYETMGFKEVFEGRDPRMAQTIWGPGAVDMMGNEGVDAFKLRSVTGYFPLKFMRDIGRTIAMNTNVILFRYPEILLAYAEAKAELGKLGSDDVRKTIDVIRARVGMPAMDLSKAMTAPDELLSEYYPHVMELNPSNYGVILEIRRERTVELVMEGHRQWDVIRWAEGQSIDNRKHPFLGVYFPGPGCYDLSGNGKPDVELYLVDEEGHPIGLTGDAPFSFAIGEDIFFQDGSDGKMLTGGNIVALKALDYAFNENRDYLHPIPAAQRALCGGKLSQNPGWEDGITF